MNGMSAYANRIAAQRAVAGLLIGLALMFGILYPIMRKTEREALTEIYILEDANLALTAELWSMEVYTNELLALVDDWRENYQLIASFLDSGISVTTPSEIRALLDVAQDMPFGSPFSNGHKVTSQYGVYSIEEYGWSGADHPGIDLKPLNGDWNIYLPAEAELIDYGISTLWGKNMTLQTSSGYQLFFAHLETIFWQDFDGDGNWSLTVGDVIPARSRIALMGSTGTYSTGPHLHYEIRTIVDSEWKTLDPESIIGYTGAMSDDNEVSE